MNLSYWEYSSWLSNIDFTVVGSGIVGLNCALRLKQQHPSAKILVLERGILPSGASTKNAGFACFGSLSEILDDLKSHSEEEMLELVKKRIDGLKMLRKNLGDEGIGYKLWGGYEFFNEDQGDLLEYCLSERENINRFLRPVVDEEVFQKSENPFGFRNVLEEGLFNRFEGQIDTGRMMSSLLQLVQRKGIKILNNISVTGFSETGEGVSVKTDQFELRTRKLFLATNGFSAQLGLAEVKPARAQVLITEPIKDLHIKGTFHLDRGYYYFRNIDNRILLGGGRNLDQENEETMELGETEIIQDRLESLLRNSILPETPHKIHYRWSGVMGVGAKKKAIVAPVSDNVYCGVRLGGMGVAIGSLVGTELADLLNG